jgi:hypothetical protein
MRAVLLFPIILAGVLFAGSANAESESVSSGQSDVMKPRESAPPVPQPTRWYAGYAIGAATLDGPNDITFNGQTNDYYNSIGYYESARSTWWAMGEVKAYVVYRVNRHIDAEVGFTTGYEKTSATYRDFSGHTVWSGRAYHVQVLHVATLLRPVPEGFANGMFFKLGGGISTLNVDKSLTGNAPSLASISAGDRTEIDGSSTGVGWLAGIGFDFRTGRVGAVRLEFNSVQRVGGTSYKKNAINVGYQVNFD